MYTQTSDEPGGSTPAGVILLCMRIDLELTGTLGLLDEVGPDALLEALLALEKHEGENKGWDQAPRLLVMVVRPWQARFVEVPAPVWGLQSFANPAEALRNFAEHVLPWETAPDELPPFRPLPGMPHAVVFMSEAWHVPKDMWTPEERAAMERGEDARFDKSPFRTDGRQVSAFDVGLREYGVMRMRGNAPEPFLCRPGDAGYGEGPVVEELLHLAVAMRLGLLNPPTES